MSASDFSTLRGVSPVNSQIQQNGRHERMHLTLKKEPTMEDPMRMASIRTADEIIETKPDP